MARSKSKPSFSHSHGTKHPMHKVTGQQLGHDQPAPVNPPTPMGSPLINPGEPGHPMPMQRSIGDQMLNPSGDEN